MSCSRTVSDGSALLTFFKRKMAMTGTLLCELTKPSRLMLPLQQACFMLLCLVVLSQLTVADSAGVRDSGDENEGIIEVTTQFEIHIKIENETSTQNTTSVESSKSKTGAVVAASIITVLACCAIVLGVYLFRRRRQSRMMDKEKKMQIQMSSARNAGIYQDLTVTDDKPNGSPEHERLKAVENA